MAIQVGVNSWVTIEDAETYFGERLRASEHWNTDLNVGQKEAALITAYRQLVNCGLFSFPSTATNIMKHAQCEMALFLLIHLEDMDARLGLQAQGVKSAGIVEESYDLDKIEGIPIPPIVMKSLESYKNNTTIGVVTMERDEEDDL